MVIICVQEQLEQIVRFIHEVNNVSCTRRKGVDHGKNEQHSKLTYNTLTQLNSKSNPPQFKYTDFF